MSKIVHFNVLKPSTKDTVCLCQAVEARFVEVLELHLKVRGTETTPPPELDADMARWRTMAVRFKSRDFRNTDDELESLKRVADWTHILNCVLRNQPYVPIQWAC